MSGYIRQDVTNNIADGNVINASDFDNEYNAIEAAFHASTGHTHDGTAAEGAPITKIGPTQDVVASASALTPKTDNTVDLGSSTLEYKDLWIDGTANIDSLVADTADINAGTIDGVTIGGAVRGAGSFTTLNANGNTTLGDAVGDTVTINGTATFVNANPTLSGGTANGVLYLNGSKVATSGSALTFDGTNFTTTGYAAGNGIRSLGGNAVRFYNSANANWSQIIAPAGTGDMQFDTGAGEQMRLTSTGLGIGTSSPATKLHVDTGAAGYGLTLAASSLTARRFQFGIDGSANLAVYDTAAAAVRMTLDGAGNLGIGTSSPTYKLDVNGTGGVRFTGSNNNRPVLIDTNVMIKGESGAWAVTHGFIGSSGTNRGGFGALGTDDTVNYYWIGSAYDSNEFVLNGGNLGIGTSSPSSTLTVGNNSGLRQISILGGGYDLALGASGGAIFGFASQAISTVFNTAAVPLGIGTNAAQPLIFGTSATERMRLDSSGNLGIGTSSPGAKLDVYGGAAGTVTNVQVGNASTAFQVGVDSSNNAQLRTAQNVNMLFYTNATERARITSGGQLGLGFGAAFSALANLDILTGGQGGGIQLIRNASSTPTSGQSLGTYAWKGVDSANSNAAAEAMIEAVAAENFSGSTAATNLLFYTKPSGTGPGSSPTERARITSGGDLQTFNTFALWPSASGGAGSYSIKRAATNALTINDDFAGQERLRITSGGDFGIGNNNPQYRLTVDKDTTSALAFFTNSNASAPNGLYVDFSAASPNNATQYFLYCEDSTAQRATIRSNGGLANYQSNNVDLSDSRTKKDIAPAASMWSKIGALEIVTYKYNDQTHDDVNVGVIAQQVEQVEPVWVDSDGFGETPEDGVPLKTVYTKDITFAAIKALQEAMTRIEQLEARVAALEAA